MKHSRQQSIETLHIFISWVRENKTKDAIQHNTSSLDTIHQATTYSSYRWVYNYGWLAQLVRASALQAGGHWFESNITHHKLIIKKILLSSDELGGIFIWGSESGGIWYKLDILICSVAESSLHLKNFSIIMVLRILSRKRENFVRENIQSFQQVSYSSYHILHEVCGSYRSQ